MLVALAIRAPWSRGKVKVALDPAELPKLPCGRTDLISRAGACRRSAGVSSGGLLKSARQLACRRRCLAGSFEGSHQVRARRRVRTLLRATANARSLAQSKQHSLRLLPG